jgi:hypothetical protein
MEAPMTEQPELPLEMSTYDHYTVTLSKGPLFNEDSIHTHVADDRRDAVGLIDGLRDNYAERADVTWQANEVNGEGKLYGLAPGGVVYLIQVVPPLATPLG